MAAPVYRGAQVAGPAPVTLVTAGPAAVGKTALINRFCNDTFNENYSPTSFFRYQCSEVVGARVVRFVIWDTSGTAETSTVRSLAYREADVFLLCYSVSDPGSLFTAINHWVPDLRLQAPATPIVLVGCQSDRRTGGGAAVTSSQALAVSQQIGAVMYVETSARVSRRGVASVMEVAALTALGHLPPAPPPPPDSPGGGAPAQGAGRGRRPRSVSVARESWDGSLRSNSSTLSSTRSDASMASVASTDTAAASSASPKISINTHRTPKTERKQRDEAGAEERLVTIKCQRLRPDKTYEEVDIQVPEAVYTSMTSGQPSPGQENQAAGERRLLGHVSRQIKCLFSKTDQ